MKTFLNFILIFFPSFIQVPIRRISGQRIGKGAKIKFGSLLLSSSVDIGRNVTIGPFCFIRAEKIVVGDNSSIKSLSAISTRIIHFGKYVHIAPLSIISSEFTENSKIEIGDHSRIFPFCWLDTGEGISIGKNVGVGGHSLIFTHGVWSDYIEGGPVSYGPVRINDNVWLPWRVFILPNVEIGENSIVGANSLVNKSFPKNVFIGGSPAKILKEDTHTEISSVEKQNRGREILAGFSKYIDFKLRIKSKMDDARLSFDNFKIVLDDVNNLNKGDLLMVVNHSMNEEGLTELTMKGISVLNYREKSIKIVGKNIVYTNFVSYLRRYGVRLYIN